MKKLIPILGVYVCAAFLFACGHEPPQQTTATESTRTSLTYHDLALKDLDQMTHFVSRKITESRQSPDDKLHPLMVGLRAVYSRPDDDSMIDKVVGPLRSEIDEVDNWEHVISEMVNESIEEVKNPKGTPAEQFTQVIFLQNIIAQERPHAHEPGFAQDIVKRIRDANLKLTSKAKNEGELRLMKAVYSPSETAAKILGKGKKKADPETED